MCTGGGDGGIWELSALSAPFCCGPKTALKLRSISFKSQVLKRKRFRGLRINMSFKYLI